MFVGVAIGQSDVGKSLENGCGSAVHEVDGAAVGCFCKVVVAG